MVGGLICKRRLTRKTTATVLKSSSHYFYIIERLWTINKNQPTCRHGYCSKCATEGVLQSSGEIVGQPKLDPKADDLPGIVGRGLGGHCRWRHYWSKGLCRTSVAEKNHRGNGSPHSIPLLASEMILLMSFPQIIQFPNIRVYNTTTLYNWRGYCNFTSEPDRAEEVF